MLRNIIYHTNARPLIYKYRCNKHFDHVVLPLLYFQRSLHCAKRPVKNKNEQQFCINYGRLLFSYEEKWKKIGFSKIWFSLIVFAFLGAFFELICLLPELKAAEDEERDNENEENKEENMSSFRREIIGFREKKIIEYENRLRSYSTADKVFRYFATVKIVNAVGSEVFMTPDDFLRSLTPGMRQPDGLGLDQFVSYDLKTLRTKMKLKTTLSEDSVFRRLDSTGLGLISFSEYIFLITVLSTSPRQYEFAFRMFDLNGDGVVDIDEFILVSRLFQRQSTTGNRHRDNHQTGNVFKGPDTVLATYFFGTNLDQKLTIHQFVEFQKLLQREIHTLEFQRKRSNGNGRLPELDFADLILTYTLFPHKKKSKMLSRVRQRYKDCHLGVSLEDYLTFYSFLNNINDVDMALSFYHIAGAPINQETLKNVAHTVAKVQMSDHVIGVVFTIFDENLDGRLSNREFVSVMKGRLQRGLERPKDVGFTKLMRVCAKCALEMKPTPWSFFRTN
ncbi:unnamed protein product, partial [Timema podura]|nr:unnamed protein product [Timema podura]